MIAAGIIYVIVFRLGVSWLQGFVWSFFGVVFIVPILVIEIILIRKKVLVAHMIDAVLTLPLIFWIGIIIVVLGLYFGLYLTAVKAKERQKNR